MLHWHCGGGIYKRRIRSGPNLQRLMFHGGTEQEVIRKLVENNPRFHVPEGLRGPQRLAEI